jgi:type VI secretion system (T6SS) effector TldE1-like protein
MGMSTSRIALEKFATGERRRSARKLSFQIVGASAAASALVLSCAWTIYANIFAASPYPQLGSADAEAQVLEPSTSFAARIAPAISAFARIEREPVISPVPAAAPAPSLALLSFDDRFAAAAPQGVAPAPQPEPAKLAEAPKPQHQPTRSAESPRTKETAKETARVQLAAVAPTSRPAEPAEPRTAVTALHDMAQRAKAAMMSIATGERQTIIEKLWGKEPSHGPLLAYAAADAGATGSIMPAQNPALGGSPPYDRSTAVYDISAHMVYLPDGTRLEAHSGLGAKLDDPSSANIRMHGVTPPHIYELKPREALFHGVPALRLTPLGGEEAIYGRSGLLAHSYMLGPNGDSNGCVSFKDYNAFLNAYRNQGIKKLAVVARVQ